MDQCFRIELFSDHILHSPSPPCATRETRWQGYCLVPIFPFLLPSSQTFIVVFLRYHILISSYSRISGTRLAQEIVSYWRGDKKPLDKVLDIGA